MYIRAQKLRNYSCFDSLELDFIEESGKPCMWIVLLGENGTGKSSILKALLHSLSLCYFNNIKNNGEIGRVDTEFELTVDDELYSMSADNINQIGWELHSTGGIGSYSDPAVADKLSKSINGYFVAAYGPKRQINLETISSESENFYKLNKGNRIYSFVGRNDLLVPIRIWLSNLEYESLKLDEIISSEQSIKVKGAQGERVIQKYSQEEQEEARHKYKTVVREFQLGTASLVKLLPGNVEFVEINFAKDVIFRENGNRVSLEKLSDGYQTVISWAGDLARHLIQSFPDMDNPLEASGVVLIDEIDLHLHPRWQRTIVKQIRETFPNLQFIVTTHSPFIVQDMTENDKIIILKRDGDRVVAEHRTGIAGGWRASQILTSPFFGLATDFDEEIEEKILERQALGDKKAQGLLTDEEREELRQVTEYLDSVRADATATGDELLSAEHLDREAVRKAAAVALRLLRKVEGK